MQESDSNSNIHPGDSLAVELPDEANSGVKDNSASVNTSGSQLLHDDMEAIEATSTTVHQSNTVIGERPGNDNDHEASENIVLATSLLNELLETISQPNLESVLYIFRQVLGDATPGHALHSGALRSLILTLGLKYVCTKDQETLSELIHLGGRPGEIKSATPALNLVTEDDGLRDMFVLGKAAWDEVVDATSPATLNTIIFLLQQSLREISSQDANRSTIRLLWQHWRLASLFTTLQDAESGAQEGQDGQMANIRKLIQVTISISGEHSRRPTREGLFRELAVSRQAAHVNSEITSEDSSLMEYGTSLLKNFQTNGNMNDLENSIEMLRLGLTEMSVNNPDYGVGLNNLASGLKFRFENHGDLHDLNESISLHRQALYRRPSPHPLRSTSLNNLASGLLTRFEQRGNPQDLDKSISLHRQALDLRPSPHPDRSMSLNNLAVGLSTRFEQRGNSQDLDESISLHRQALDLMPSPHPLRSSPLNNLAGGLSTRFKHRGNPQDLDESISLHRQALDLMPSPHPHRSTSLNNLANGLSTRFEQWGNPQDLDKSISLHRQALDLRPSPHPDRSMSLNNLAGGLSTRFEHRGNPQDLDESISLHRQALDLMPSPHPHRSMSLNNLANGLSTRFEQWGNPQDLDESISLHRQALDLRPSPHPDRSSSLNNLANGLSTRFEQRGNPQDLDKSISLHRQALDLMPSPHPGRSMSLTNLASGLSTRFKQRGNPQDLDESISLHRQALDLMPSPHPDRFSSLNNLANGLSTRFDHQGNPQDLDESISLHRQALDLRSSPHPGRPGSLNNLASGLSTRFNQRGNPQDLDESISLHRQALDLRPSPHPDQSMSLNNLANGLSTRFNQRGNPHDLDESISLHRQALDLRPSPHPGRSMSLTNLASGLSTRSNQRGNPQDLDESISLFRQALDLRPSPHPDRSISLNNLASGLFTRFQQRGNPQDLDESISLHRQALDFRPSPHPDRSGSLLNLANTLNRRFQQGSTFEDLETNLLQNGDGNDFKESARFYTECIQLSPVNHPHHPLALGGFADLYFALHKSNPRTTDHLNQAIRLIEEAANSVSASPSARYHYARSWAHRANTYHHPSALQAFALAVGLMPQLVAQGHDIQSRQDTLTKHADGLAGHAAQCAIRLGDFAKAVQFLETGRSIFWSQFLSLRSPLDKLADISPDLAEGLRSISRQLEKGSHRDQISGTLSNREKLTLEAEANNYTKLAKDWDDKVEKVRQLEGFEDFLRPQRFSALQTAAGDGPMIYLVANDNTSDCLVITASTVHHIPLPKLHSNMLAGLVRFVKLAASDLLVSRSLINDAMTNLLDDLPPMPTLRQFLDEDEDNRGMRPETGVRGHISSDQIFQDILGILWDEAVKPVIDVLGLTKSSDPPKLTWCATGLFTFLPIHAAGRYDKGNVDCASEYFISSYTPTIQALLTPDPPSSKSFQMMAVIQSQSLPSTNKELLKIEQHVEDRSLTRFGVKEAPASVEEVAAHLAEASIVHFACHGKQDSTNPLQSGLQIGGERLTIARIMRESLPNGSLAFLSACETAMGDEKIPDEAMNIASSLLFTGFRKVVATMWRMWDEDGPVIADAFYKELFTGPDGSHIEVPHTSKSAKALWIAVKELRSRGVEFRRWVPFIHMGK